MFIFKVVIRKDFKYLGIIRANPVEYVKRYGASLKPARELPDFVLDIKPPNGVVLAADYQYNGPQNTPELEGDVHALRLIDLERAGLGEYRAQLDRFLAEQSQHHGGHNNSNQQQYQQSYQVISSSSSPPNAAQQINNNVGSLTPQYNYNTVGQGAAPSSNHQIRISPTQPGSANAQGQGKLRIFVILK